MLDFEVVHHLAETQSSTHGANADQLFVNVGGDHAAQGHVPVIHHDVNGRLRAGGVLPQ